VGTDARGFAGRDDLAMSTSTQELSIKIDFDGQGGWEVDFEDAHIPCETLDDARRVALLTAARRRPCELLVRDAYHRVIAREHVAAPVQTSSGS
jgi:hypothetical protein